METSNNGPDRSAQSNKGIEPSAHLRRLSRKNHPAQFIVGKDNPANSLDQRMNRRVSAFM